MAAGVRPGSTLILGFSFRSGLAISRSLHRRGVRVIVATLAPEETPLPSRTIARFISLVDVARDPAALAAALRRIIAEEHVDMVIPITDGALYQIAPLVAELRRRVIMACPDAEVIACALDKTATAALATRSGILLAEMKLIFGCMIRKQLVFREWDTGVDTDAIPAGEGRNRGKGIGLRAFDTAPARKGLQLCRNLAFTERACHIPTPGRRHDCPDCGKAGSHGHRQACADVLARWLDRRA